MIKWKTDQGDTVEVYATPARCLRTECTTAHREFRYRVRAANGEIVEQGSEGYTRKEAATNAAERYHPRPCEHVWTALGGPGDEWTECDKCGQVTES